MRGLRRVGSQTRVMRLLPTDAVQQVLRGAPGECMTHVPVAGKAVMDKGFPCMCICLCPNRHYRVDVFVCKPCTEKAQENPLRHGETVDV